MSNAGVWFLGLGIGGGTRDGAFKFGRGLGRGRDLMRGLGWVLAGSSERKER